MAGYAVGTVFYGWGEKFTYMEIHLTTAEGMWITLRSYTGTLLPLFALGTELAMGAVKCYVSDPLRIFICANQILVWANKYYPFVESLKVEKATRSALEY